MRSRTTPAVPSSAAGHLPLIAVVKANAYGHGMCASRAPHCRTAPTSSPSPACTKGAAARRGITQPILIAGPVVPAKPRPSCSTGCCEPRRPRLAHALANATRRYLPVHVEVDTGWRATAWRRATCRRSVDRVVQRGRPHIAGVFTHFASADLSGRDAMLRQLAKFTVAVDGVARRCAACGAMPEHARALLLGEGHLDAVRIRGGLYGSIRSRSGRTGPLPLRPALALKAAGRVRDARREPRSATAALRVLAALPPSVSCRSATAEGLLARTLERGAGAGARRAGPHRRVVSMNQTVVDVTGRAGTMPGDEVVLIGSRVPRATPGGGRPRRARRLGLAKSDGVLAQQPARPVLARRADASTDRFDRG